MRLKITTAFVLILSMFSCKKDSGSGGLIGKWQSTEVYLASDGQGTLLTKDEVYLGGLYVQFNWLGSAQSTFFSGCKSYSVKGNVLTLNYNGAADVTQATFTYSIIGDTLTMYPTVGCSGCSYPFVRE